MPTLRVTAALVLAATGALAQTPAIPVSDVAVTMDPLPQPVVTLGDVEVRTDVVYAERPGFRPLRMDIYAVPGAGPQPLVVYVHGGGWTTGNKRNTASYSDFPGLLADLARQGFVVAAVEYRLSGEAPFPAAVHDVAAAVRFLRKGAAGFGIDPARVGIWGGSAGAHLSAMTALACDDPGLADPQADPAVSACVQALVGWYGPYDIGAMLDRTLAIAASGVEMSAKDRAETEGGLAFFGCTGTACPADIASRASPLAKVDSRAPPALLIHGTADTLVPHAQSEALHQALTAAGVAADLRLIEGVGHGWASSDPAAKEAASRDAAITTFRWLAETLQ